MSETTDSAAAGGEDADTEPAERTGEPSADDSHDRDDGPIDPDRATRYLQYAAVVVLLVTALVALVGFYTGVSRVIEVWVAEQYRPVFNAAFNLALLLGALAGIGLLLRRLD